MYYKNYKIRELVTLWTSLINSPILTKLILIGRYLLVDLEDIAQ